MQELPNIDCRGKGYEGLTDAIIKDRYKIGKILSHGSFGHIMTVEDITNPEQQLVIKIQQNQEILSAEIESLIKVQGIIGLNRGKLIRDSNQIGIPNVINYGILVLNNFQEGSHIVVGYYLMPKYEKTLYEHLEQFKGKEYQRQVILVALQLVGIFKILHASHRTYNDLKPQNIMINTNQIDEMPIVHLVDYGFAAKFVKGNSKEHIEQDSGTDTFKGNIEYSSLRQMNFLKTSRKDDFVSLFYMVTSLLNHNKIIKIGTEEMTGMRNGHSVKQYFIRTKVHKEEYGFTKIIETLSNSDTLREEQQQLYENLGQVASVIDGMSFKDKPEYSRIKQFLKNCVI